MPSGFRFLLDGADILRRWTGLNVAIRDLQTRITQLRLDPTDGVISNNDQPTSFSAVWIKYTSNAVANTEDTVAHSLGRVPVGVFVARQDKSATVYDSGTAWTSTNLYLKSSAASVAWTILVF